MAIAMVQVQARDTVKEEKPSVLSASTSAAAQTLDVVERIVVVVLRLVGNAMQILHTKAVPATPEDNCKAGTIRMMNGRSIRRYSTDQDTIHRTAVEPILLSGFEDS